MVLLPWEDFVFVVELANRLVKSDELEVVESVVVLPNKFVESDELEVVD